MDKRKLALLLSGIMVANALSFSAIRIVTATEGVDNSEVIESVYEDSQAEGQEEACADSGESLEVSADVAELINNAIDYSDQTNPGISSDISINENDNAYSGEDNSEEEISESNPESSDIPEEKTEPSEDTVITKEANISSSSNQDQNSGDEVNNNNSIKESGLDQTDSSKSHTGEAGDNTESANQENTNQESAIQESDSQENTNQESVFEKDLETAENDKSQSGNFQADDFQTEKSQVYDEDIQTAVDNGVFDFNGNSQTDRVIIVPQAEESLAAEDETTEETAYEIENDSTGEGNDINENRKYVTVEVYTNPSKNNNTNTGKYVSADYTDENGTKLILTGLTEANKDGSVDTILDYYNLLEGANPLDDYSLKVVNSNYVDAEKYSTSYEDKGFDTQHCWAAVASEMLWISGWAGYILPDTSSVDDVMQYYQDNFTDNPGEPAPALSYLFNGNSSNNSYVYEGQSGIAQVKEGKSGNADTTNTQDVQATSIASRFINIAGNLSGISLLEEITTKTVGALLRWLDDDGSVSNSAHWLTAVGVIIDTNAETVEDKYKAIILADSDNDGARKIGSATVESGDLTREAAYNDKVSKTNSYTVYGLSTAKDKNNNNYWSISNYLGNSTTKAIISGFEYLLNLVIDENEGNEESPTTGDEVIPEEEQNDGNQTEGLIGPELWEDEDYWDEEDYQDEWKDNSNEDEPGQNQNCNPDTGNTSSPADNTKRKERLENVISNQGYGTDTKSEEVSLGSGMEQADIDQALKKAQTEQAIVDLSLSSTKIYFLEDSNYNKNDNKDFNLYIKGTSELISSVSIDGIEIPANNYKIITKTGNVVQIAISKELLGKIKPGNHIITISYKGINTPVLVQFVII